MNWNFVGIYIVYIIHLLLCLSVPGYVYGDENKYIVLYWTNIGSILFYALRAKIKKIKKNKKNPTRWK